MANESEYHREPVDFALWNTLVYQAWTAASDSCEPSEGADFVPDCKKAKLADDKEHKALAILWLAFCLEYRLKKILKKKRGSNQRDNERTSLGDLLGKNEDTKYKEFWRRLGKESPQEWAPLIHDLGRVWKFRNALVHGNHLKIEGELDRVSAKDVSKMFNAVFRAIRICSDAGAHRLSYSAIEKMTLSP